MNETWKFDRIETLGAVQPKSRLFNTETGEYAIFKPVSHRKSKPRPLKKII
jgi:hypothetical protein